MPRTARKSRAKRTGMFIYCTPEEKKRIKAIADTTRRSLSDYVMHATMLQVVEDEKRYARKG